MIPRKWRSVALVLAVPLSIWAVAALPVSIDPRSYALEAPKPALVLTGRVVDAARILDRSRIDQLTELSKRLKADTKVQFVVATTPSLHGSKIERYSLTLANTWQLGDRERNNGLLLLIAPNEHQVRIEVGKGLERVLPNVACKTIVNDMIPLFRKNALGDAVLVGAVRLDLALRHSTVKAL